MKTRFAAVGLAAVLLAACACGAKAQSDAMMPPNMSAPSGTALDYKALNNRTYDFADLYQAKAHSLSDSQIATIAKIAKRTNMPFRQIACLVYRGDTFAKIADRENMSLGAIRDVTQEEDEIAAYKAAYLATGEAGEKQGDIVHSVSPKRP